MRVKLEEIEFDKFFKNISSKPYQISKKDYLENGDYPVIDQGQKFIVGYSNNQEKLFIDTPIIIFGDHTRIIKYIDFNFVIGADGTKILVPFDDTIDAKYAYYQLLYTKIENLGYSRHYKLLKEKTFIKPLLTQQKTISKTLDKAKELIELRKASIEKLDELSKSVFIDMFGDPVENPMGWESRTLGSIFKVKHGFAFKSEFFTKDGDFVLLTPGNFFENGGFRDRGEKQKYYVGDIPSDYILSENSLLLAMTEQAPGLLGSPLIVPTSNKFLHNQRLGLVTSGESIEVLFLFHVFNQKSIRQIIHFLATGIKVRHTSPLKIEAITIGYPPLNLQNKFAKTIQKIESQKALYEKELVKLEENFEALLAKSFG